MLRHPVNKSLDISQKGPTTILCMLAECNAAIASLGLLTSAELGETVTRDLYFMCPVCHP